MVEVVQADRDAAADLMRDHNGGVFPTLGSLRAIRLGLDDDHELVQAFARHRLAHSNEGWRGIESAPRDGTEILLLAHGMAIQARYCPGRWGDETPDHPAEYDGAVWCAFDDAVQFEIEEGVGEHGEDWNGPVTHWQPLPTPPSLESQEGQDHG